MLGQAGLELLPSKYLAFLQLTLYYPTFVKFNM